MVSDDYSTVVINIKVLTNKIVNNEVTRNPFWFHYAVEAWDHQRQ